MKRTMTVLSAALLSLSTLRAAYVAPALERKMGGASSGGVEVLVIYRGGAVARGASSPAAGLRAMSAARPALQGVSAAARSGARDLWLVNGFALKGTAADLKALAADPRVEAVIENVALPAPSFLPSSAGRASYVTGTWGLRKIGALEVRALFGVTGRGVRIGHLDTGVDASHPELAGKIDAWAAFDASGNRLPDAAPRDVARHGTHTAGVLVGETVGVAPGARLLSARVLDDKGGTLAQIIAGLQWTLDPDGDPMTDDGARIVNLSLGAAGRYPVFDAIVENLLAAGVLPVFATGNEGEGNVSAPANVPRAFAVGAAGASDDTPSFSGGAWFEEEGVRYLKPDIAAPGEAITSCVPGNRYASFSGTSMAAPHVAGAAALYMEAAPDADPEAVREAFLRSAADIGEPGPDARAGRGRLDVLSALSASRRAAVIRGVTGGPFGPVAALVRVRGDNGFQRDLAVDDTTGRFQLLLPAGRYLVEAVSGAGVAQRTVSVGDGAVVDVDLVLGAPEGQAVSVYPNPFKPARGDREIVFAGLPSDAEVTVYSLSGSPVRTISPTAGVLAWDARDDSGRAVASGLYYYVANVAGSAGPERRRGKLTVIR